MFKKLLMAFMALTALTAFALPATASAKNEPTLMEGATHVPVGATIVGTNEGETTLTNTLGEGLVHCTKATMTGTVTKNSGDTVEGTIATSTWSGTGTSGDCTGSFGPIKVTVPPLCIKSNSTMATDEFQIYADNCSSNLQFTLDVTGVGSCVYEATAGGVKGDFTTNNDKAKLTVRNTQAGSGSKKLSGSFLCPSSGMLKMTFNLATSNGTAVTIVDTTP